VGEKFLTGWQKGDVISQLRHSTRGRLRVLYSMEEFGRDCCIRGYHIYKSYGRQLLEKCWSDMCEKTAQRSRSVEVVTSAIPPDTV